MLQKLANRILADINNTIDRDRHHDNLATLHTCFFNGTTKPSFMERIEGLNESEGSGVKPYVEMLIDNFVHGEDYIFNKAVYLT